MHHLFQSQWASAHSAGDHDSGPAGQRRGAQPHEAPHPRDLSAAPGIDCGRMGRGAEPAPGRGDGHLPDFGARAAAAIPTGSASGRVAKFAVPIKTIVLGIIRFYQGCISPTLPSSCRFYPSCSAYAYEAVEKWGVRRGASMAVRRLLRCRPFAGRGYDPVP